MIDSSVSYTLGINMHLHVRHKWTLLIRSHIFALNANNSCSTRTDFYLNFFFRFTKGPTEVICISHNTEMHTTRHFFRFVKQRSYIVILLILVSKSWHVLLQQHEVSCHKWIEAVCPNSCLMLTDKIHGAVDVVVKFTLYRFYR